MNHDELSPPEILMMKHRSGFSLIWTPEEDKLLFYGLACFPPDSSSPITRYKNIARFIVNKNIRDVALRCRYMEEKEKTQVNQSLNPTHIFDKYKIINELLIRNKQYLNLISFKFSKLKDNILFFSKSVESIRKILNKLNEIMIEPMISMPPLPENLKKD